VQYMDDTMLVIEVHSQTLHLIFVVIDYYALLSGLKINKTKSSFILVAIFPHLVLTIQIILQCQAATQSTQYLCLPLSLKKLKKIDYQPLIQTIQGRLKRSHGVFLSPGGRTVLVKSVLSSMPMHYMQIFKLPKGIIKHIDKNKMKFSLERK
jgi:hypothetical protein